MSRAHSDMVIWKQRVMAELLRDKKRSAILISLLVVAMFLGIRLAIKQMSPAKAAAGVKPSAVSAAAALSPDASGVAEAGASSGRQKPIASLDGSNRRSERDQSPIVRDIFLPNPKLFPPAGKKDRVGSAGDYSGGEMTGIHAKRLRIQKEAFAMHLESTIEGTVPIAIINGQVLAVGDRFKGFRVVQVRSGTCTVEKEGISLVLKLTMDK
jgi:hypothetical protein